MHSSASSASLGDLTSTRKAIPTVDDISRNSYGAMTYESQQKMLNYAFDFKNIKRTSKLEKYEAE